MLCMPGCLTIVERLRKIRRGEPHWLLSALIGKLGGVEFSWRMFWVQRRPHTATHAMVCRLRDGCGPITQKDQPITACVCLAPSVTPMRSFADQCTPLLYRPVFAASRPGISLSVSPALRRRFGRVAFCASQARLRPPAPSGARASDPTAGIHAQLHQQSQLVGRRMPLSGAASLDILRGFPGEAAGDL